MNLLLVDDHALFREGLRALLAKISPDDSIYEAASVEGAIDECRTNLIEMVLLDLGLSSTDGLETLDKFRNGVPSVPVVVLSGEQASRHILSAIEHGAVGFIPKSYTSDEMIVALRDVGDGKISLPLRLLNQSSGANHSAINRATDLATTFARLSPRQKDVAKLLLLGSANKVIAKQLGLSEGTVKAHVSAIFQIIGVTNRAQAVIIAAQCGIKIM